MPFDGLLTLSTAMQTRLKAAALLETGGWCQYTYWAGDLRPDLRSDLRPDLQRCMVAALLDAAGIAHEDRYQIEPALFTMGFTGVGSATAWNDAVERTKEEVIACLKGEEIPHAP